MPNCSRRGKSERLSEKPQFRRPTKWKILSWHTLKGALHLQERSARVAAFLETPTPEEGQRASDKFQQVEEETRRLGEERNQVHAPGSWGEWSTPGEVPTNLLGERRSAFQRDSSPRRKGGVWGGGRYPGRAPLATRKAMRTPCSASKEILPKKKVRPRDRGSGRQGRKGDPRTGAVSLPREKGKCITSPFYFEKVAVRPRRSREQI